jgi:6,7-dimethyl-8-ribityllumazine synthase
MAASRAAHRLPPSGALARPAGDTLVGEGDGTSLRVGVACARFNHEVTERLLDGALAALDAAGVPAAARLVVWVPGAFELPLAALALARAGVDAVACLGAVVRGETSHYDFVAGQCAAGLQRVQLDTGVPVAFGVLTTDDLDQAFARAGGALGNKGEEAVATAIEMANLLRSLGSSAPSRTGAGGGRAPR